MKWLLIFWCLVRRIIITGAPASGKGTQCERIVEKYGVVHISTGDLLRAAVKEGTELGKQAFEFMNTGRLGLYYFFMVYLSFSIIIDFFLCNLKYLFMLQFLMN